MRRAATHRCERHVSVGIRALLVVALVIVPAALPVVFAPGALPVSAFAADAANSPVKITKTHTTSITQSGNDAHAATIGERITHTVTVTVPSGQTLPAKTSLVDQMAVGFMLRGEEIPTLTWNGGALSSSEANTTGVPGQRSVRATLGTKLAGPGTLVLEYSAYVANVNAAVHGAGLVSTATLEHISDGVRQVATASDTIRVVEPDIGVTLTGQAGDNNVVDPGERIPLTVTVTNAAEAATANDSVVSVVVPGSLTLDTASIPTLKGESGTYEANTRTVSWKIPVLSPGESASATFTVSAPDPLVLPAEYRVVASATTSSFPGAVPGAGTYAGAGHHHAPERQGPFWISGPRYSETQHLTLGPTTLSVRKDTGAAMNHRVNDIWAADRNKTPYTGTPAATYWVQEGGKGLQYVKNEYSFAVGGTQVHYIHAEIPARVVVSDLTLLDELPSNLADADRPPTIDGQCTGVNPVTYSGGRLRSGTGSGNDLRIIDSDNRKIVWSLGDLASNPERRDLNQVLQCTIKVTSRTLDLAENMHGTSITNSSWVAGNAAPQTEPNWEATSLAAAVRTFGVNRRSNAVTRVYEPNLTLTTDHSKHVGGDQVGSDQDVPFTLTITNDRAPGDNPTWPVGPAEDVTVVDTVPTTLTPILNGAGKVKATYRYYNATTKAFVSRSIEGEWNDEARTITWVIGRITATEATLSNPATLDFELRTTSTAVADQPIINRAEITSRSRPGGTCKNDNTGNDLCRDGTTGHSADRYRASASDALNPSSLTLDKTVDTVRDEENIPETLGSQTFTEPGGEVDYELRLRVPRNITGHDLTITDTLPVGLTVKPGSASVACRTLDADGVTYTDCDGSSVAKFNNRAYTPQVDGQTVRWYIGDLNPDKTEPRYLVVKYTATVEANAAVGTPLVNRAFAAWNITDKFNDEEVNESDPGAAPKGPFEAGTPEVQAAVTVQRPRVVLHKSV